MPDTIVDGVSCVALLTVLLDDEETVVEVGAGQTLLQAADAAGLFLPALCRQGHCGTCIVALKFGTVALQEAAVLSKRDRDNGMILTCQALATSATLRISYDD